jgi:hypothetical protein
MPSSDASGHRSASGRGGAAAIRGRIAAAPGSGTRYGVRPRVLGRGDRPKDATCQPDGASVLNGMAISCRSLWSLVTKRGSYAPESLLPEDFQCHGD